MGSVEGSVFLLVYWRARKRHHITAIFIRGYIVDEDHSISSLSPLSLKISMDKSYAVDD